MTEKKTVFNSPQLITDESFRQNELFKTALETIKSFKMLENNDSVLVSISGGPDSVFLAVLLKFLQSEFNLSLFAFHLDHLTRNGRSSMDADFVKSFCKSLDLKLFFEKADVSSYCASNKINFQEGARVIRHDLLDSYAKKNEIKKIAVAHNADDNIETFMMNIMRGAGLRGMSSIKPRRGKIIRPLIFCYKKDINDFLSEKNISFCVDSTNLENKYFRNKIRNKLVPYIEKNFEKDFKKKASRSISSLRSLNSYVENLSYDLISDLLKDQGSSFAELREKGFIVISASAISFLEEFIKAEVIIRGIEIIKGDLKEISHYNISDIVNQCFPGGESKTIDLTGSISFLKEGNYIYFYNKNKINAENVLKKGNYLQPVDLIKKNEYQLPDDYEFSIIPDLNYDKAVDFIKENEKIDNYKMNFSLELKLLMKKDIDMEEILSSDPEEAYMDFEKIKLPVKARLKRDGDRFLPLGMKNEKKLQDFFTDMKISLHKRSTAPVFFDSEKIIWISELRIDDRVKIAESTKEILYFKITKI